MNDLTGTTIRDYEVQELIGQGGMGAVYRARHIYLDEERALKIVRSQFADDQFFIDHFVREARVLAKLKHPNLVQLYEFGLLEEHTFFMVLELLRGESVEKRIRRQGRFPVEQAIAIARQAALGLHSAHQKGIIHRDVSPDNILLCCIETKDEIVKVIDFGLAKPAAAEEGLAAATMQGTFVGKPDYASPEQWMASASNPVDYRADIYSLGVTLFEMLAGKRPFQALAPNLLFHKHLTEQPPSLNSMTDLKIPPQLSSIVDRMLAKRREDRYASLADVIDALDACGAGKVRDSHREPVSGTNLAPGSIFANRYRIEQKLSAGHSGTLYKAMDQMLAIHVALKIVDFHEAREADLERLKKEVLLARKIIHPSICRFYDIGQIDGLYFVTTEFLQGQTLSSLLEERGKLSWLEGVPILRQLLEALGKIHSVGLVHRDIKANNILIDEAGEAHLVDFGIHHSPQEMKLEPGKTLLGTPHYAAPEYFEGKEGDHRADLYAVGVLTFQMFTGQFPFNGSSQMQIALGHLKLPPPRPRQLGKGIPMELENVILKALRKHPEERYQSAAEMWRDLEFLAAGAGSLATREAMVAGLIARQEHRKAIRLLTHLMARTENDAKWQELLDLAKKGKAENSLRRLKRAVRKRRFVRAMIMIDALKRAYGGYPDIHKRIRKIEIYLQKLQEGTIELYVGGAEQMLANNQVLAAMPYIQAAQRNKPGDARVAALQKKLHAMQQQKVSASPQIRVLTARELWQQGKVQEAQQLLQTVLKEKPLFQPAVHLLKKITKDRAASA